MHRELCRAKIHQAVLSEVNPAYTGSLTVPPEAMEAADIVPYEKVQVANLTNGNRLETYIIPGTRAGWYCLNGAAALTAKVGDVVLCIFYGQYEEDEARGHLPTVVLMNPDNTIDRIIQGHI